MDECISQMRNWDDDCIDHCITDPPFNLSKKEGLGWAFSSHVTLTEEWDIFSREDYLAFSESWIKEVTRVVKPNGNIFIFGSYHNIYDMGHIISELGLKIVNSIVWFKPNAQPNITCRMLTESTEHVIWACNAQDGKAKNWVFNYDVAKKLNSGKQMRNVWSIPYTPKSEKQFGKHPSQKPIDLLSRMILIASNEGETILDCFGGSGTTAVVANSYSRNWILIDQDPKYNEIARDRIKNVHVPLPEELLQMRFGFDDK